MNEQLESTCPVCGGWDTEETDREYSGCIVIIFKCHHCNSKWKDIYRYDTSRIIKEEGRNV